MKTVACSLALCAAAAAQAQGFVAAMSGYGEYPGYLRLIEMPGTGPVWEFDVKGRADFFEILEEIHQRSDQQYEVKWGERDKLLVKAVTHSPTTGKAHEFEIMLRTVLNAAGMTYRIEGGLYNVMRRPSWVEPPPGAVYNQDWVDPAGETSLDHIARALSNQRRGYRVDRVAGKTVWLRAPVLSWDQLLWVVTELDPGLMIVDDGSVVVITKRER